MFLENILISGLASKVKNQYLKVKTQLRCVPLNFANVELKFKKILVIIQSCRTPEWNIVNHDWLINLEINNKRRTSII